MENNDIFVKTLLTDKIKLQPGKLSRNVKNHLLFVLQNKFEGVCSYHGFIKPASINIHKHSLGSIMAVSLNGDVEFKVQYYADVCNPSIGSIVHTKIVNSNKFGFLAYTGIRSGDRGVLTPILEIIIAKANSDTSIMNDNLQVGDEIYVEIIGKKFELGDKKICAIGRINTAASDKNILDADEGDIELDNDEVDIESEAESSDDETTASEKSDETEEKEKSHDGSDSDEDDFGIDEDFSEEFEAAGSESEVEDDV